MAASVETLPGSAQPEQEAQCDPRIVPRRIVRLTDDRTIAYAETGSGPDLVAIHGTLMCLEDLWLGPVPALAEHFRVVAVDRPGHGFSLRPRGQAGDLWDQAERIREAVQHLGLHQPVILGHSFGGAVALAYGLLYPDEITGVVSVAPICFPEPRLEHVLFGPRALPFGGDALSRLLGATSDRALLPLLWNAMYFPRMMPDTVARNFPFDLAARPAQITAEGEDAGWLWPGLTRSMLAYPSLRVPVRLLAGSADLVVNTAVHAQRAARMIPDVQFELLPGAGHMLHHFHPDAVVRAALSLRPS
ncbi:Pimeloyl-ACP methyl ester carboxylesterase [Methylobacterium phyllostachyos]|uniref:Pimeloyl-ACP methyl ester carboxylesterase n=1 Tax=Methylobacterium phyllostachyos TaxID=582672 RepID=A0A1G9SAM6_9HYPH|nr:alpha/beta hydrolase [Methylobacterium phyllostachyos]SDM32431.1 Pimeloyl-ACP methyl ester carboxylesterase [Methylobacterium phyllostachyos]